MALPAFIFLKPRQFSNLDFDADPDHAFDFDADPAPAFNSDPDLDPDPASLNDTDPVLQHCLMQWEQF